MPTHSVGDQRWQHVGYNSGGDKVYNRKIESDAVASDYDDWTKDELAAELESRGLAKSGTKAELIARLQDG